MTDATADLVSQGTAGTVVPVVRELVLDADTPVGAYARIVRPPFGFLLESAVGGDGGDVGGAARLLGGGAGVAHRLDDGRVAVPRGMDDLQVGVASGRHPRLGLPLEHQDDPVVGQVGHEQPVVQSGGRLAAVAPPAVRGGSDHVGAVDDEHPASTRAHRPRPPSITSSPSHSPAGAPAG